VQEAQEEIYLLFSEQVLEHKTDFLAAVVAAAEVIQKQVFKHLEQVVQVVEVLEQLIQEMEYQELLTLVEVVEVV
jgi:hypothetical protein